MHLHLIETFLYIESVSHERPWISAQRGMVQLLIAAQHQLRPYRPTQDSLNCSECMWRCPPPMSPCCLLSVGHATPRRKTIVSHLVLLNNILADYYVFLREVCSALNSSLRPLRSTYRTKLMKSIVISWTSLEMIDRERDFGESILNRHTM